MKYINFSLAIFAPIYVYFSNVKTPYKASLKLFNAVRNK